jgi:hypothetical protein
VTAVLLASNYSDEMQRQGFLLAAAGLGASFTILYQLRARVIRGSYPQSESFEVVVGLVLGLISGTILAQLLPVGDVGELGSLTKPTLALVGGFSFALVFRVLKAVVESVEALFGPDSEEKAELDERRIAADVQDARTALAAELTKVRTGLANPAKEQEIDRLIASLTSAGGG